MFFRTNSLPTSWFRRPDSLTEFFFLCCIAARTISVSTAFDNLRTPLDPPITIAGLTARTGTRAARTALVHAQLVTQLHELQQGHSSPWYLSGTECPCPAMRAGKPNFSIAPATQNARTTKKPFWKKKQRAVFWGGSGKKRRWVRRWRE
nr:hypothetical protein Iba_chr04fCG7030 [Ipomoea batatas]